jgi:hypothetical protein
MLPHAAHPHQARAKMSPSLCRRHLTPQEDVARSARTQCERPANALARRHPCDMAREHEQGTYDQVATVPPHTPNCTRTRLLHHASHDFCNVVRRRP